MNRGIVNINNVPTEIITYGRWIEEKFADGGRQDIIIIISGNPGVPAFYQHFAEHIQNEIPSSVPIWIIGHTGNTKPPDNLPNSYPDIKTHKHLYDMQGNLEHKIQFIKQYAPPNAKIHIIAHSIGSWFTLNLLKNEEIADSVIKCYLLFPTIERMAESPTGRFLTGFVFYVAGFLICFSWLFNQFPHLLQVFLIRAFGLFFGIPENCTEASLQLVHPEPLKRIFLLARDEMIVVKELDDDLISKHKKKLFLYYGSKDGWTPVRYFQELKSKYPDLDAHWCRQGFQHCFVLKDAVEMGKMIGQRLSESIALTEI